MTAEHRQAITRLHRTVNPIVIGLPPKHGRTVARDALEHWHRNFAAAIIDEQRTEGHQSTRRPLSSAHEAP